MGRLIMEDMRDTMRRMITSVVVAVLLGGFTLVAVAQLLPEIMADRYLCRSPGSTKHVLTTSGALVVVMVYAWDER